MADTLTRPDVEVSQEIRSTSPTIIRPTLVPFIFGVGKEVVEVTTADGLVNEAAKQGIYAQLPSVISQTAFPSPRSNISEVNVEEGTIRAFLLVSGALRELDRDPGSSFLWGVPNSDVVRPFIDTKEFVSAALDGKTLVVALDTTTAADTSNDVVVTFSKPTGNMTPAEVAAQLTSALGVTCEVVGDGPYRVRIASSTWGAKGSVTVRQGGSANTLLGFASGHEYRIEGAGFRAQDQSDGRVVSSWVEWFPGNFLKNKVDAVDPWPTTPASNAIPGYVDIDGVTYASLRSVSRTFTGANSLDLKAGDEVYVDGLKPNSAAIVMKVESDRFRLGTVNTKLSTFDSNGNLTAAVYDPSVVGTLLSSTALAPKYVWFKAKNLVAGKTVAEQATLVGGASAAAARAAQVTSQNMVGAFGSPVSLAGLTLRFDITKDGVEQDTQTFTFTGGPFANIGAVVSAFNAGGIEDLVATDVTIDGSARKYLRFSTVKTGSKQTVTLRGDSTALVADLGFTASTAVSGTGSDPLFIGNQIDSALITFATTALNTKTLVVQKSVDYGDTWTSETCTFAGEANTVSALVTAMNGGLWGAGANAASKGLVITQIGATNAIRISSTVSGVRLRIDTASSTALDTNALGASAFTTDQAGVVVDALNGTTLRFSLNNRPKIYSVPFVSNSLVDAVDAINSVVDTTVASIDSDVKLALTSFLSGYASQVLVKRQTAADQTCATALGFGSGGTDVSDSGTGRPYPDFYVDGTGSAVIGGEIVRSPISGRPLDPTSVGLYIQYTGVRLDLSPLAATPALLRFSDVTTMSTVLSPINTKNPLGLGCFMAMVNAPGVEIAAMGVDAISSGKPYGTPEAYARVLDFVESAEIYAMAPLTDDATVASLCKTHVVAMSAPAQKGERVVWVNLPAPTRAANTLLASGLDGRTNGTANQFVGDATPLSALATAKLDADDLKVSDDVVLETQLNGVTTYWNVSSVSSDGHVFTLRTTFGSTENTDGFYTTTALDAVLVNADWQMYIRGKKLVLAGTTIPDKAKIAETVAGIASSYKERRFRYTFPDKVKANIGGIDQSIPGFYACAATAGIVGGQPPQQGHTNFPIAGLTGVVGSSDMFKESQLAVMAAGGVWAYIQDTAGAPPICRHQLTTDMSSIERREASITHALDFSAKFFRRGMRSFIGSFNINPVFLDILGAVADGLASFLQESGIMSSMRITKLEQNAASPDEIIAEAEGKPNYPCNRIKLKIVI